MEPTQPVIDIHIWRASRPAQIDSETAAGYFADLSDDERARFKNISNPRAAARFLTGRRLMRQCLSKIIDCPPESLIFDTGPSGKPYLRDEAAAGWNFNLSHAGDRSAFAAARHVQIGIDIEAVSQAARARRIAAEFFSHAERAELERPHQDTLYALKLWVLKEATVKAIGKSVWHSLSNASFSIQNSTVSWLSNPPEGKAAQWKIALSSQDGYLQAVSLFSKNPIGSLEYRIHETELPCLMSGDRF